MAGIDFGEIADSDREPFTSDEIEQLAQIHKLPIWPVLKAAINRYQARAFGIVADSQQTMESVREAQGRLNMARQLVDLLETDAPTLYDKRQEPDANDDD